MIITTWEFTGEQAWRILPAKFHQGLLACVPDAELLLDHSHGAAQIRTTRWRRGYLAETGLELVRVSRWQIVVLNYGGDIRIPDNPVDADEAARQITATAITDPDRYLLRSWKSQLQYCRAVRDGQHIRVEDPRYPGGRVSLPRDVQLPLQAADVLAGTEMNVSALAG